MNDEGNTEQLALTAAHGSHPQAPGGGGADLPCPGGAGGSAAAVRPARAGGAGALPSDHAPADGAHRAGQLILRGSTAASPAARGGHPRVAPIGTRRTASTHRNEREDVMGRRTCSCALATALLALVASACANDLVTPPSDVSEPPRAAAHAHLGLVEATISGIGTETSSATAISAPTGRRVSHRLRAHLGQLRRPLPHTRGAAACHSRGARSLRSSKSAR